MSVPIIFLAIIILLIFVGMMSKREKQILAHDKHYIKNEWKKIEEHESLTRKIFEAEQLVRYALKKKRYKGTFEEMATNLKNNEEIIEAYKIKEGISDNTKHNFNEEELENALENFKQALIDLDCL